MIPFYYILLVSALFSHLATPLKPDGFGRFGRIHDDGLLTLNVSPYGFEAPSPMPSFKVRFADKYEDITVERINFAEKKIKLSGGGSGAPTELFYTLLYPGYFASFQQNAFFAISGSRVLVEESKTDPNRSHFYLLITAKKGSCMPVALSFRQNFKPEWKLTGKSDGTSLLEISHKNDIGNILIFTPLGMRSFSSEASQDEWDSLRRETNKWIEFVPPQWNGRLYDYNNAANTVSVRDDFYIHPESINQIFAPLPPVLAFAISKGYPAKVEGEIVQTDCITKYGPFAYVKGKTLKFTLPLPPLDERGYIRLSGNADRIKLLNSLVGHLGGDWATNAVDLGYAGMANAQMAWVWLDADRRLNLQNAWKTWLPMAFRFPPYPPDHKKNTWKAEIEPFTGFKYLWTYSLSGPPPENFRLDIDWGNALPLYGLYKYAQYSGDWEFVRNSWDGVMKIFRYFELGDDWAWMTVVNGDMGWSTGTGDPMAAAFCGHVACLKMAKALGKKSEEDYFAFKTAMVCVPTVARFWYTDWARNQGFFNSNEMVQGFWEKETFTSSGLNQQETDPWGPTNILSGDGILPELFDALNLFARPALEQYEKEYAAHYPNWADGAHPFAFDTTYNGNSVYVTFPHIFARAILGEPLDKLWAYVDSAKTNPGSAYWVGPNVIAELLSHNAPLTLIEWQPAAFQDGYLAEDGKTVILKFQTAGDTKWVLKARLKGSMIPQNIRIDGTDRMFEAAEDLLLLSARVQGPFTVEIVFREK
jgi:hypothetical protein